MAVAPPRTARRHTSTTSRPLRSGASVSTINRKSSVRPMSKILRGLRGATTATANTSEAILDATAELLRALQTANGFRPEEVESAIFTSSPDLTAECLARCIRVLLHFYTSTPPSRLKHMYLREAAKLRPDR